MASMDTSVRLELKFRLKAEVGFQPTPDDHDLQAARFSGLEL